MMEWIAQNQVIQTQRHQLRKAIEIACYELNPRPRLNRASPLEEAIKLDLEQPPDISRPHRITPHKCVYRDRNNQDLKETEALEPGTDNAIWTTDKKEDLNLRELDDLQA